MYDRAIRLLAESGLFQYELSNFARPGYACRHNIGYWKRVPCLGLGVSAASFLWPSPESRRPALRTVNPATIDAYLAMIRDPASTPREQTLIAPAEARFETMMLGLRMTEGVSEDAFLQEHGMTVEEAFGHRLAPSVARGLLIREDRTWRLTRLGMDFQNQVLVDLMD